jgi:hypothetical protein
MWETGTVKRVEGNQDNDPTVFSRTSWEKVTTNYLASIRRLEVEQWEKIYDAARDLNRELGKDRNEPIVIEDDDDNSIDPRTLIGDDI